MGDANRASLSGIAHDLAKKVSKNRDETVEAKAVAWMTEVLNEAPPPGKYEDSLKDGIYLCKVINKICPGSVKKIYGGSGFTVMQNHEAFQKALAAYGVPPEDLFQTVDLWEKRNIPAVTKTIYALARTAAKKGWGGPTIKLDCPTMSDNAQKKGWDGPELGPKMATENKREFTEDQLRAGEGHIGLQAGYNKGATQHGISMGGIRHIVD